jgi:hypothetical protein
VAIGPQSAKLSPQLLGRPNDQRLELVGGADLRGAGAVASRQQDPQRLPVPTATGRQQVVLGQRLSGGADGVQGVTLGPGAPRRPLGPADLDHPLAAGLQERRQPGAVATRALHRPAASTGHLHPGELEQLTVAGRVCHHRRLGDQATHHVGYSSREGVAVGVDADHSVDDAGQPGHRSGSSLSWSGCVGLEDTARHSCDGSQPRGAGQAAHQASNTVGQVDAGTTTDNS